MKKIIVFLYLILFIVSMLNAQDNKETKKEVSFLVIEKVPVYPNCKGSNKELKECFSQSIQKLFFDNFNMDLANQIGLAGGKYRVFIGFKITAEGKIDNIMVRAPHIKIKREVIRVMNLIPQMIPGEVKEEKVAVKYSIPFTMLVEETKQQRRERRRKERKEKKY